jgi:hypothetical protein
VHRSPDREPPARRRRRVDRGVRSAQQQHVAVLVEQHHPRRGAAARLSDQGAGGPFGDLEVRRHRGRPAQVQEADERALAQRQRVADGVVVEPAGQQHARLGVGEFGDQWQRHRRRVHQRQFGGQVVLGVLPAGPRGTFGDVGQCGQPLPGRTGPVGVGRHGAGHHGTAGECAVERLPGQVVAHVQSVQPVGGLVGPHATDRQHEKYECRDDDEDPTERHPATWTFTPAPATVS